MKLIYVCTRSASEERVLQPGMLCTPSHARSTDDPNILQRRFILSVFDPE
jgi:hypothetical protein